MPKFSRPFLIQRRISRFRQDLRARTQQMREKLLDFLEVIFDEASRLAKGEATVEGKPLTLKQRQAWAKVASYTAQVINSITKTIDEREIDEDLAKLENMIKELQGNAQTHSQNSA